MIPERTCANCGGPFTRRPAPNRGDSDRFCSLACGYAWRRAQKPSVRRMRWAPDHPLVGKKGYVVEARMLLYDKIGPGVHACHWCGSPVEWSKNRKTKRGNLIVDHADNDPLNNDLGNLVPSCQQCNVRKDANDLVLDDELYVVRRSRAHYFARNRAEKRICATCGKEFLFALCDKNAKKNAGTYCSLYCLWHRLRVPY